MVLATCFPCIATSVVLRGFGIRHMLKAAVLMACVALFAGGLLNLVSR